MSKETQTYRDLLEEWIISTGASKDGEVFRFSQPTKVWVSFGKDVASIDSVETLKFGEGGYVDIVAEKNRTFTMLHRIVAVQVGEEAEGRPGFL